MDVGFIILLCKWGEDHVAPYKPLNRFLNQLAARMAASAGSPL